jgi:hypothetical protein
MRNEENAVGKDINDTTRKRRIGSTVDAAGSNRHQRREGDLDEPRRRRESLIFF